MKYTILVLNAIILLTYKLLKQVSNVLSVLIF